MNELQELIDLCKCSVCVTINQHRDYHQSAEAYLKERFDMQTEAKPLPLAEPEVLRRMVELDTIIEIQFYPETPVGFYRVFHHDLDMAIDECLATI